jgi:hypothetical protein
MTLRAQVFSIIALAVLVWVCSLWVYGTAVDWAMLKPFGTTVTVVTLLSLFFERVAWKWPLINGYLVRRPVLDGTWRTDLLSSFRDEEGNRVRKTVFIVVQQTLLTMSLRMYTDKARSFSIAESIRQSNIDDLFEVAVVYQNVPNIAYRQGRDDSQIHFGALHLTDVPAKPKTAAGPYWTDRNTNGELTLLQRKKVRISSYAEGMKVFEVT